LQWDVLHSNLIERFVFPFIFLTVDFPIMAANFLHSLKEIFQSLKAQMIERRKFISLGLLLLIVDYPLSHKAKLISCLQKPLLMSNGYHLYGME